MAEGDAERESSPPRHHLSRQDDNTINDSAEEKGKKNTRHFEASPTTQSLRALAQSHLDTISAEDVAEAERQTVVARELERYAKVRKQHRHGTRRLENKNGNDGTIHTHTHESPSPSPSRTKGPKLRSAQDVLDRLRHDSSLKMDEYRVGYLERFDGIMEMPVRSWIDESTHEDWIPQHRIKFVKRVVDHDGGKRAIVVWDRHQRIDLIFGSGGRAPAPATSSSLNRERERELETETEIQSEIGGVPLSSLPSSPSLSRTTTPTTTTSE